MTSLTSQLRVNQALNRQSTGPQLKQSSFRSLFRFTKSLDYFLMITGSLAACLMGASVPLFCFLYGNLINSFTDLDSVVQQAKTILLNFIYLGFAALVTGWIMMLCWTVTGERQSNQCRKQYLKSLLNQQIGWFDTHNQSQMATQFSVNTHVFRSVLGQKIPIIFIILSMFISGVIIAFVKGWLMAIVVFASLPFFMLGYYLYYKNNISKERHLSQLYSQAGSKAQEALSSIKTIKQLNGHQHEIASYSSLLNKAMQSVFKYGIYAGASSGLAFSSLLLAFTLAMWFGSECVEGTFICPPRLNSGNQSYSAGDILIIFYGLLFPAVNLGQLAPAVQKVMQGKEAAYKIFEIIDRKPTIVSVPNSHCISKFKGIFVFENVSFSYPKDKSTKILHKMSFEINTKSSAFIGQSGCGKSTIFQLIMRFYDPDQGAITLDGIDLRQLDLNWLRSQIGYVGQQPVLFATSIRQNLLLAKADATEEQMQDALSKAGALDFVKGFQDGLQTFVGSDGSQLSGGQKQRIAIARALLRGPKILLLDQATSALDSYNQKLIQATLNKISQNCISIKITHHLQTIRKCQCIFLVKEGHVFQQGIHTQLSFEIHQDIKYLTQTSYKQVAGLPKKQEIQESKSIFFSREVLQQEKSNNKIEQRIQGRVENKEQKIYSKVFSYIQNKLLFVIGICLSIISGVIFPLFGIFNSKIIVILLQYEGGDYSSLYQIRTYLIVMLIVSISSFANSLFQQFIYTKIAQELTLKIRKQTFSKMIKMPICWFESKQNSDGHIAASLEKDCRIVNGIFSSYINHLTINISTLLFGIILALFYEWRVALIALALLPLIVLSQAVQLAYSNGVAQDADKSLKQSAGFIKEAIDSIRTVKSLNNQQLLLKKYSNKLEDTLQNSVKKGNVTGVLFGCSYLVMYIIFALIFYFGAIFIKYNNVQLIDMFTAVYLTIFSGIAVGNNTTQMPDLGQAKNAARNIFSILDEQDEDQLQIKRGSLGLKQPIKGNISFRNIDFKYENRNELVLRNVSFDINQGQKIGLVGHSGSGKSTVIQLLLGFYTPTAGKILIDGINLTDYDIYHLRAHFGVVSQEPILFNQTIEYNIKYNKQSATQQQIQAAADQANFNPDQEHYQPNQVDRSVVMLKESGFSKTVGPKGAHVSGGQKQRIAIARMILRNPSIILLDEATSALDKQNQQRVQHSLDKITYAKTCITVTHHMQNIKNANKIIVFNNGEVIQTGVYSQLSASQGHFTKLLRAQSSKPL